MSWGLVLREVNQRWQANEQGVSKFFQMAFMTVRRRQGTSLKDDQTNVYPQPKGIHIMNMKTLTALTLASLMAVATGSAFAGSTGPTDPVNTTTGPRDSSTGPNTDGTPKTGNSSTPGTKGMGSSDGNGAGGQGGGMSNGNGMGGSGGGAGSAGGAGGSSGSK